MFSAASATFGAVTPPAPAAGFFSVHSVTRSTCACCEFDSRVRDASNRLKILIIATIFVLQKVPSSH